MRLHWVQGIAVRIFMVGIGASRDQQLSALTSTDDREDTEEGDESNSIASDPHSSETEGPDTMKSDDAAANPDARWGSCRVRSDKSLERTPITWNRMPSSQSYGAVSMRSRIWRTYTSTATFDTKDGPLLREAALSTQ